jgi:hypothetical protein
MIGYSIVRRRSVRNLLLIGLGPIDLAAILAAPLFNGSFIGLALLTANTVSEAMRKHNLHLPPGGGWALFYFISLSPWIITFIVIKFRLRRSRNNGNRTNLEWDNFVNHGLRVDTPPIKQGAGESLSGGNVPQIEAGSGVARWLEGVQIAFHPPVTLNLQGKSLAEFLLLFELVILTRFREQLLADGIGQLAFGRVVLHGKNHCIVFRQPNENVMIFFLFRVEVVGVVASIICGGTHLIRRESATGEKARRNQWSDDDVLAHTIHDRNSIPFWRGCIPFWGIDFSLQCLKEYWKKYVVADAPYSWMTFGELGYWQAVDHQISTVEWPGLQPDRSAALAELDYMKRMAQNEVLREMQTGLSKQGTTTSTHNTDIAKPARNEENAFL